MELTVLERLVLLNILPKEGDFTTLKLVRKAREALSFDDLENKKLAFIQDGDQVRWNESADVVKDIELGEMMTIKIIEELKKMDKEQKLREEQFTIYEKFVDPGPREDKPSSPGPTQKPHLVESEGEKT